jgi:hypothetical protein
MNALASIPDLAVSDEFLGKDGRRLRITKPVRTAIEAMVFEGLKRSEAAARSGITDHALYTALTKQHIKAYRRGLMDEMRTGEGHRAYVKLTVLKDSAASEHVQMESSKWVAGVAGISPVQKQEVKHSGSIDLRAGYVIDLTPKKPGDDARDITPADMQSGDD